MAYEWHIHTYTYTPQPTKNVQQSYPRERFVEESHLATRRRYACLFSHVDLVNRSDDVCAHPGLRPQPGYGAVRIGALWKRAKERREISNG